MAVGQHIFEKDFVSDLIPQKSPFVMVDKMLDYSETKLVAGLTITSDNIFCTDGVFREPGIVEHMAQSVALHTGYQFYLRNEAAPTGYIGSINSIQISELPKIGDDLQTEITILQEFAGITLVDIATTRNGDPIAVGQMKTVLAK